MGDEVARVRENPRKRSEQDPDALGVPPAPLICRVGEEALGRAWGQR